MKLLYAKQNIFEESLLYLFAKDYCMGYNRRELFLHIHCLLKRRIFMLNMIIKWVLFAGVIMFTAWLIPGISVDNFWTAMLVCIVITLINIFLKPIISFISMPVNFLTLGLFSFVINAILLWFAGYITPGFSVDGFLSALLGSIILAVFVGFIYNKNEHKK